MVQRYFEPMKAGRLKLTYPSGEVQYFGSGEPELNATLTIKDPAFFRKGVLYGDVGFGESYVDGDWETDDVTRLISWMIMNLENHPNLSGSDRKLRNVNLLSLANKTLHWLRRNTMSRSRKNIHDHYDLSNEFFATFLDPGMTYSCARFIPEDTDLESAQTEKIDLLCRKLRLKPGQRILEIGCGWGGFAAHVAAKYGCHVTGVTISEEQWKYSRKRISDLNLSDRVSIELTDYRKITGSFDRIVSIEMLEAVGHRFLEVFFRKCHEVLKPEGVMGLQVITCPDSRYDALRKGVDWTQKHIFPGSLISSVSAINRAVNRTGEMFLHHMEEFGMDYARTLAEWRSNFNQSIDRVRSLGFKDEFLRKWNYYLGYCEAAFRMRNINVVQMIYTRPNNLSL